MPKLYLVKIRLSVEDDIKEQDTMEKRGIELKFLVRDKMPCTTMDAIAAALSTVDRNNLNVINVSVGEILFKDRVHRLRV